MTKAVRILDFKILPHGEEFTLRVFIPGDVHVDFVVEPRVLDELGKELTTKNAESTKEPK